MTTEAEIDAAVGRWLETYGAVPHYQVDFQGHRIDVVGDHENGPIAVESKVRGTLALVAQALRSRAYASETWVAAEKMSRDFRLVASQLGLGILRVEDGETWIVARAANQQPRHADLKVALHPEQKATTPGAGEGFSTEWSRWAARFVDRVRAEGELRIKDALDGTHPPFGRTAYERVRNVIARLNQQPVPTALRGLRVIGRGAKARVEWVPEEVF